MMLLFDGRQIVEQVLTNLERIQVSAVPLHGESEGSVVLHFAVQMPTESWLDLQAHALKDDLQEEE